MYIEQPMTVYLADAAANKPAPGGGSVSALVGALGATMGQMTANFTIGKKKYADVEEQVKDATRTVLRFSAPLAPVKAAILPLLKNRAPIVEMAKKIAMDIKKRVAVVYDDTAAIGKLYRRQDEVGTLYCVTVDVQSLEDQQVTVRDRDTMQQDRIDVARLEQYLADKMAVR